MRGRCDARCSQEVAVARQGARRRREAGQGARGRPIAPRRSLLAYRLDRSRTGTLLGFAQPIGWSDCRMPSVVHI
jgi:hypothetical protein